MLFALIITHLFALAASNPFHKYPYVFLLDVGNEELQKTNSEQIRVSIPGGSLALRYPAIGDGEPIAHVRVSGIDFGTDLKVNIVDGGPGSNYVVLVFMGNPGVAYDAVLTIQTVPEEKTEIIAQDINSTNDVDDNTNNVSEEEANNSAEELDNAENGSKNYENSELTQSSSHYYNYAQNEQAVSNDDDHDLANKNGNNDYNNEEFEEQHAQISNQNIDAINIEENNDSLNEQSNNKKENEEQEAYNINNGYIANEYNNNEVSAGVVGNLYYDRLNFIKPYFYRGVGMYPDQATQYEQGNNLKTSYEAEIEGDQEYMNDNIHEVSKDNNNNNYDSDNDSPVES